MKSRLGFRLWVDADQIESDEDVMHAIDIDTRPPTEIVWGDWGQMGYVIIDRARHIAANDMMRLRTKE